MKITSSKTNKDGVRIVCEDAVFDPSLAKIANADKDESVILLAYDALESGNPLSLPFTPSEAEFIVKLTPTGIHISLLIASSIEDETTYSEYENKFGYIEFDVKMNDNEKLLLTHRIAMLLLSKLN